MRTVQEPRRAHWVRPKREGDGPGQPYGHTLGWVQPSELAHARTGMSSEPTASPTVDNGQASVALSEIVTIALIMGTALCLVAIIVNFVLVRRERRNGRFYAAVANDDTGDEIDMDAWVESCAVEAQEATEARAMNTARNDTAARIERQMAPYPLPDTPARTEPVFESLQMRPLRLASQQSEADMMADQFFDDPASPDHQIRGLS